MGADATLWPPDKIQFDFASGSTTVYSPTQSLNAALRAFATDLGNFLGLILTGQFTTIRTEQPDGTLITDADVYLVVNTVNSLEAWEAGGPDPSPDGPSWVLARLKVLDSTEGGSVSNRWVKLARTFQSAISEAPDVEATTPPADRFVFVTLEVVGGATAGRVVAQLTVTLTAKGEG